MSINDYFDIAASVSNVLMFFITVFAVCIAYRTLHAWKDKEKFAQLVRLKRSIFSYRQKVENLGARSRDNHELNEYIVNVLQPVLSDIYHEMKLSGYDEDSSMEFKLFDEIFSAQGLYMESQLNSNVLLDNAVELQKAIKVSFNQI